jgi:hypothetical protein
MANKMTEALIDIETAGPIRQVKAFFESDSLKKIIPSVEDRKLLSRRVNLYIALTRSKNAYDNDSLTDFAKYANRIAAIGVGQALGGINQAVKQTVSVAANTFVTSGSLDIASFISKSKNEFINKSGYAIQNRGMSSQAELDAMNKLAEKASTSTPARAIQLIEKANQFWLKKFLANPDIAIARIAWMSYYEQSLKKKGVDVSKIDYETHKIDSDSADYAQSMVDNQQNISDPNLGGKLFTSKKVSEKLILKTVMTFATFRMNQSARIGSDWATFTSKTSSKDDKVIAARSLSGFAVELAVFRAISAGTIMLINSIASKLRDEEEDDEKEEKKLNGIIKGQVTSAVNDLLSPIPFADKLVQYGANKALDIVQDFMDIEDDDKFSLYTSSKSDLTRDMGLFGITADRVSLLYDMIDLAYTREFTDDYGNKKKVSQEDADVLKKFLGVKLLSDIGILPNEANSIARTLVRDIKKDSKKEGSKKKYSKEEIARIKKTNPELAKRLEK